MILHHSRTISLGFVVLGLILTVACGGDATSTTSDTSSVTSSGTRSAPSQEDLEDVLAGALLTEDDLPDWTASTVEGPDDPPHCLDVSAGIEITGRASVEFGRASDDDSGDTFGVFQNVFGFADASSARRYVDAVRDGFEACLLATPAEGNQLTANSVAPMTLTAANLEEDALGWSVDYDPDPIVGDVVTTMEIIFVRRGGYVSMVLRFLPVAAEVDLEHLGSLAYERLPT